MSDRVAASLDGRMAKSDGTVIAVTTINVHGLIAQPSQLKSERHVYGRTKREADGTILQYTQSTNTMSLQYRIYLFSKAVCLKDVYKESQTAELFLKSTANLLPKFAKGTRRAIAKQC